MSQPTYADECEAVLVDLISNPASTTDAIGLRTKLPQWRVSDIIIDLRLNGRVTLEVGRIKGKGKVNLYSLKLKG